MRGSNGGTDDRSAVTIHPGCANIDLLFVVIAVEELCDGSTDGENSLRHPKDVLHSIRPVDADGAQTDALIEIPDFECFVAGGQEKLMVRVEAARGDCDEFDLAVFDARVCPVDEIDFPSYPNVPDYDCAAFTARHKELEKLVEQDKSDWGRMGESISFGQIHTRLAFYGRNSLRGDDKLTLQVVVKYCDRNVIAENRLETGEGLKQLLLCGIPNLNDLNGKECAIKKLSKPKSWHRNLIFIHRVDFGTAILHEN